MVAWRKLSGLLIREQLGLDLILVDLCSIMVRRWYILLVIFGEVLLSPHKLCFEIGDLLVKTCNLCLLKCHGLFGARGCICLPLKTIVLKHYNLFDSSNLCSIFVANRTILVLLILLSKLLLFVCILAILWLTVPGTWSIGWYWGVDL